MCYSITLFIVYIYVLQLHIATTRYGYILQIYVATVHYSHVTTVAKHYSYSYELQ